MLIWANGKIVMISVLVCILLMPSCSDGSIRICGRSCSEVNKRQRRKSRTSKFQLINVLHALSITSGTFDYHAKRKKILIKFGGWTSYMRYMYGHLPVSVASKRMHPNSTVHTYPRKRFDHFAELIASSSVHLTKQHCNSCRGLTRGLTQYLRLSRFVWPSVLLGVCFVDFRLYPSCVNFGE